MKRFLVLLAAAALATTVTMAAVDAFSASAAPAPAGAGEQADSVRFALNFRDPEFDPGVGDVVYCGVAANAEPFVLDVAVASPPLFLDPEDPAAGKNPSHEGAGWLGVALQGKSGADTGTDGERGIEFNVPFNDSFSFGLTLGGTPGVDQLVQLTSIPAGDEAGGGHGFRGFATVRAQRGAVDPFEGDGRSDNFCVSVGPLAEYPEGTISTKLPVRDDWVVDGDGSDGGVLVGFPH